MPLTNIRLLRGGALEVVESELKLWLVVVRLWTR